MKKGSIYLSIYLSVIYDQPPSNYISIYCLLSLLFLHAFDLKIYNYHLFFELGLSLKAL